MQPDRIDARGSIRRIAAKEVALFFASPTAYLFLGSFAAVTLFVFFWGEAFFARNVADVRPMFEWMPFLLVFLCSTLTMRLWSEERRTGTLEHVLTQPVPLWWFVAGKFLGCLALLCVALVITLPLPFTVALLGDLDWGPVWAGYLATFLLGAAYLSIGLFISARSDNPIVSLISAVAVCGLFYLIGTPLITDFFGNRAGEVLRLFGTGSRFDSITRGVIDLRDLYYYLSLIAAFLVLNTYSLERERWSRLGDGGHHRYWQQLTLLLIANAVGANLWLGQLTALRVDATAGNLYSISPATEGYLAQLQEPLLLRGYFSTKTHPLLAPLVPQLRDLMQEYAIAGKGRVRVEFVDPVSNPQLEDEANQQYGIEAVPFQVADRYQSSIVSSYFNVLVKYGDEYQTLGFNDLIEVKGDGSGTDIDVQLRNPEHDLTRAIRKVLGSYQSGGNLFDTVQQPLTFTAYVSADEKLPDALRDFHATLNTVLQRYSDQADGRLKIEAIDPDANGGQVARQIAADYGFRPLATSLFSSDQFYFYLTLGNGTQLAQIPLDDMSEGSFERNLKAAIQRFSQGFTKTVALVAPSANPMMAMGGGQNFQQLRAFLGSELNVVNEDLSDGSVAGNTDLLLLAAPENLDEKAVFAVDQFLMQGGTVIALTSPYKADLTGQTLSMRKIDTGLEDWLEHQGLSIGNALVMDPQNSALPIPVTRNVGGFSLREWRMLDYPYFLDVRGQGLAGDNLITTELPQITLAWASPITVDEDASAGRELTTLLRSSPAAWLSDSTDVSPRIDPAGNPDYATGTVAGPQTVGVISAGSFTSYFAGKDSPLLAQGDAASADAQAQTDAENPIGTDATSQAAATDAVVSGVIEKSPESARLIVISSNDFLDDQILQLLGTAANGEYDNSVQLVANAVDWSLEDTALMSIRSRSHFNRTLPPLAREAQELWEYGNYALAALAVGLIALLQRRRKARRDAAYARLVME
ncbi:MAG TPA: Gldg family protein [Hyphomicrobiales bacterium]|nr:Gldg family protein [Hyphomicrobiales bacterium]